MLKTPELRLKTQWPPEGGHKADDQNLRLF